MFKFFPRLNKPLTFLAALLILGFAPLTMHLDSVKAGSTDLVYPTNYLSVQTDPVTISPTKNIPALFDGNTTNFALINYVTQPVGVIMQFDEPKNLAGFTVSVGGYVGASDYNLWKVEAASNLTDLSSQTGTYIKLMENYPTDGGTVDVILPADYTAQVFKLTSTRNNANGYVHWAELTPRPTGTFTHGAPQITKKVFSLIFNPTLSNNQTVSQYENYHDPVVQAQELPQWFRTITTDKIKFDIVQQQVVNAFPRKADGYVYDETSYLNCVNNIAPCHSPDGVDYSWVINTYDLCGKLNRGEIDEVWMNGGPYFGFNESALVGPNAYGYNGPAITNSSCTKLLPIMGYNFERTIDEQIHDFGHRTEATMTQLYATWQENRTSTSWDKFGLDKTQSPSYNYTGCGSVHYAPNSASDYDYGNTTYVDSNCADFVNYPNLGDPQITKQSINCTAWGCSGWGYYKYWFQHLPANAGVGPDGRLNNWWYYVTDPNRALYLEPVGRTNVALNAPIIAAVGMQGTPASVTDGFTLPEGASWNTTQSTLMSGTSSYVTVDLQNTYDITLVRFQGGKDNTYLVQISPDNATWSSLAAVPVTGGTGERSRQIAVSGTGRYLKITETSGVGPFSVDEVEAYTDIIAPAVAITSPVNNAVVNGITSITANASDNFGVSRVEFYVDGSLLSTTTTTPYSANWDATGLVQNSSHILTAKAYDSDRNNTTSTAVTVTVLDSTAPSISISSPADAATVSGVVAVVVSTSDNVGVTKVELYVDDILTETSTTSPFTINWNTTSLTNGTNHAIYTKAYDAAGNTAVSATNTVLVSDLVNPIVSITSPANNATVSGSNVSINASASDDVGVTRVEFYVDGNILSSDTTAPFSASWDTTSYVHNSTHTLTAKAFDAAGNFTTSSVTTVTVADVTAPTVSLTSPANGTQVGKGTHVTITATASDLSGITKVEFYVNGVLKSTDTTAPYSYVWTVPSPKGVVYTLMVKAYDTAGNTNTSSVTVTSK